MTDEELRNLFTFVDDLIEGLNRDYTEKKINISEYLLRTHDIMERYGFAKGMPMEKNWLEWKLKNTKPGDSKAAEYTKRLEEIKNGVSDSDSSSLIGIEVISADRGEGVIISHRDKFVPVEFYSDNRKATFQLETALKCRSLKFADEAYQRKFEKRFPLRTPPAAVSGEPVVPGTEPRPAPDSLAAYFEFVNAALDCSLSKYLFSVTLIIRCNDDAEYYDMLTDIHTKVFSGQRSKKIVQDTLVSGARRWDSSVDKTFKNIVEGENAIESVNVCDFSSIDPIFTELIYTIRSACADGGRLFALRVKENDNSTAGLVAAKMPVFEIRAAEKKSTDYIGKLYSLFPARLIDGYSEVREILNKIISAEMKSGSFTGAKSLESVALKISHFVCSRKKKTEPVFISVAALEKYYESAYATEEAKKSALDELRGMLGMEAVLDLAEQLIAGDYQNKLLRKQGKTPEKLPRHIIFRGPSGCGKTTAARLISKALNEAGISRGYYEANARNITGRYLGETRYNTLSAIQCANEGILFLDEAYALSIGDEYGREAISTLLTAMEEPGSNLTIIFAGYADEMDSFLNSNPGLRSRIGYTVDFRPYDRDELFKITMHFLENFTVGDKAVKLIRDHFHSLPSSVLESPNFGLARYSRNVASKIKSISARRHWLDNDGSTEISSDDVRSALRAQENPDAARQIGFAP